MMYDRCCLRLLSLPLLRTLCCTTYVWAAFCGAYFLRRSLHDARVLVAKIGQEPFVAIDRGNTPSVCDKLPYQF